jgi:hypothetical protein
MVRDFIRCPYNRNNGTSAADDIIQVVRQNDTRQIKARPVIVRQIIVRQIRSKFLWRLVNQIGSTREGS